MILQLTLQFILVKYVIALTDFEIYDKIQMQAVGFFQYMLGFERTSLDKNDINFYLYEPITDDYTELFENNFSGLERSNFQLHKKTIIIIHGYTDNKERSVIKKLRRGIATKLNANVLIVDWQNVARQIYMLAVYNSIEIGKRLGSFLNFLKSAGVNLTDVHIIGHSLGAHIAGIAGECVDGKIGRITGLDPAGPLFEFMTVQNTSFILDKSDALFVDVIHTAIGVIGIQKPIGHADFYPNYGETPQPGCTNLFLAFSCSHARAVDYFLESISNGTEFLAKECKSWKDDNVADCKGGKLTPMGYFLPASVRGTFYLQTNVKAPFAMGRKFFLSRIS